LEDGIGDYADRRNVLAAEGTSRLSQDLHWGLLSPTEVATRASLPGRGPRTYVSELAWRDFFHHVLWHFPEVTRGPFNARFDALEHEHDAIAVEAWQQGRTGYPVVDAAMRQVIALGWMHNRARMIVASFLTKHLLVDYRVGEEFFMRHLVDGSMASNNGGWQWAASTGTDAQPYFRIFNPTLQGQRFDPDGAYIRRWVRELAQVPDEHIHEPWLMPEDVQKRSGCRIGVDYPEPIVDHMDARMRALEAFTAAGSPGR
jgi:deoxyribodipyrimidine photo-lyase